MAQDAHAAFIGSLHGLFKSIPQHQIAETGDATIYSLDGKELLRINRDGHTFVYLRNLESLADTADSSQRTATDDLHYYIRRRRDHSEDWKGWWAEFKPEHFEKDPEELAGRLRDYFKNIGRL